ncbi:MAG: fibro-slime domain-containing protein [Lachnospiraceae bacterium]|jgi:fibro-slime domain-containing protein/LPXTG-motif cell wall-anchored protein|nr:fibro-slime domain-containing protein [Lachnospiraceae bacterium]
MQKLLREYLDDLNRRQKKSRKAAIAAILLVVMVVGSVTGILSRYGVAMTGAPTCGQEEHQHGEACYTEVIACGLEESEGHTHGEECSYPAELSCALEENEEHAHGAECYQIPEGFACGQEEGGGHAHSEACYAKEISCGKEEHIHMDICYIDAEADVEDQAVWDQQYDGFTWTGVWGQDLVMAAQTQIGYQESVNNYTVAEGGNHKGYTRYGQFAGDLYGDWDAAFVNFCMHYAGLEASGLFPRTTDSALWCEEFGKLSAENGAYLVAAEGYTPFAGDLIFFRREGEETAVQMGIVASTNEAAGKVQVIEGNSQNMVRLNEYGMADSHITGYLKITELEAAYKNEVTAPENLEETDVLESIENMEETDAPENTESPEETDVLENMENQEETNTPEDEENSMLEEETEERLLEFTTKVEETVITLSGPESSFEEGKEYSIQAEKLEAHDEKIETIEEAIEKVAEEKAQLVKDYQAFDIKLMADGEEVQPLGPVAVKFSGHEVAKSVEDEKTEVKVIHVDETSGEAEDMEVVATEEYEVTIETEHFSIYVYVETEDIFGKATLTVEHWGRDIETVDGQANAVEQTDTVYTQKGGHGSTSGIKVKQEDMAIYSADVLNYPNGSWQNLKEISKICKVGIDSGEENMNYIASEVWISTVADYAGKPAEEWVEGTYERYSLLEDNETAKKEEGASGEEDGTGKEEEDVEIRITGDSVIRFWYEPKKADDQVVTTANFYDYDIGDGLYWNSDGTQSSPTRTDVYKYLKTDEQGINSLLTEGNIKFGIGQKTSGNLSSWVQNQLPGGNLINGGNKNGKPEAGVVPGIVTDRLTGVGADGSGGTLEFAPGIAAPAGLFQEGPGSTEYQWPLGFKQNGDTYTLQYVNHDTKHDYTQITTRTRYESGANYYGDKVISSNDFWPLDGVGGTEGHDPLMGQGTDQKYTDYRGRESIKAYSFLKRDGQGGWTGDEDAKAEAQSDDSLAHNWYFGMTYEVEFTIGDYIGPMEYYFRGDDDFWLFIDGKRVVDIGGIHSALGQTCDLRAWMTENGMITEENKEQPHYLKVFYMERGATGSCCYMQFTLPDSKPVEIPTPGTTSYEVKKLWDDGGSGFRPTSIVVRLEQYREGQSEATGKSAPVILDQSNNWTKKWDNLPIAKGSKEGQQYRYSYSVEEINLPAGYEAAVDENGNLTNTLKPVELAVEKIWLNDEGVENYRPKEVLLRLYYYNEETDQYEPYQYVDETTDETKFKDLKLDASSEDPAQKGKWIGKFTGLPQYRYTWNAEEETWDASPVQYCVREMYQDAEGNLQPVEHSETIQGNGAGYRVSYSSATMKPGNQPGCTESSQETPGKLTVTNTLLTKFRIVKRGTGAGTPALTGAEFSLIPDGESGGTEYKGISGEGGVLWWTSVATGETVSVLEPGDYVMKEVKAPAGHGLSDTEWKLHVGESGRTTITEGDNPVKWDQVETGADGELTFEYVFHNDVLYVLPATGGSGIYWYSIGGILLMLAGVLILYKKRVTEC